MPKQLNELQPCNGDWYCDGCHKLVHDFRGMDEAQILDALAKSNYQMCGLFEAGRIAVLPKQNKWFRTVSAAAMVLGLAACKNDLGQLERVRKPDKPVLDNKLSDTANRVFVGGVVSIQPQFPGGEAAFGEYLKQQINLNGQDLDGVTGKLYVQFKVGKDGSLTDIQTLKSSIPNVLIQRVVEVFKNSPKWTSAVSDGKPEIVQYTLPINFALE